MVKISSPLQHRSCSYPTTLIKFRKVQKILSLSAAIICVLYYIVALPEIITTTTSPQKTQKNYAASSSSSPFITSDAVSNVKAHRQEEDVNVQTCLDQFTGHGFWEKDNWVVRTSPFCAWIRDELSATDIQETFRHIKVGFSGDSTTRSDLRAFEEALNLRTQTNWDEKQVFQKVDEEDRYICRLEEQSINLTKCGIPPIVNTTNFRYFYKVYPFAPLDQWYFRENASLFQELDVFVVSFGGWSEFQPYLADDITDFFDQYLHALKKVFSGQIIFQTEYPFHDVPLPEASVPIQNCPHGYYYADEETKSNPNDCVQSVTDEKPRRFETLRKLLTEKHPNIPFIDRWDLTKTLPLEYYQTWLCGQPDYHPWFCDHHLGFVGMLHLQTAVNVIRQLIPNWKSHKDGFMATSER